MTMRGLAVALILLTLGLGALPAQAAPHAWLYSYEGTLATAMCIEGVGAPTCQTVTGGGNTARHLSTLGFDGTPYRWAGNITWGGLPTSAVFQATLMADVDGAPTELERLEGPTVIEFDFHLDDHPGASAFALHIHGLQPYDIGPVTVMLEHRQTFFVDGHVFTR